MWDWMRLLPSPIGISCQENQALVSGTVRRKSVSAFNLKQETVSGLYGPGL